MRKSFLYQAQGCTLSLREALAEYYQAHPGLLHGDELEPKSAEFFRAHDICHVVFGLDTNLEDEALADFWALMGTDVGLNRYVGYLGESKEAMQILKQIGLLQTILTTICVIPKVGLVFAHTRRMKKKWPWTNNDGYMGMPLNRIRSEFGIVVL